MKTVKNLSKNKHAVGIFFHVDKKATVLATVDKGAFNRGDVAYDQHGLMICRAVYDPSAGDPVYDAVYEVTKIVTSSKPEPLLQVIQEPTVDKSDEVDP